MKTAFIVLASLLISRSAAGQSPEPKHWEVRAGGIYEYIPGKRPTGGPGVAVAVHYAPIQSESVDWTVGSTARSFAWAGGWRWAAVMAGAETSVRYRPVDWIGLTGLIAIDYGQWPECTDWGLCVRFWGLTPRMLAGVSWHATSWGMIDALAGVRHTSTIIHPAGWGIQAMTTGTIRW